MGWFILKHIFSTIFVPGLFYIGLGVFSYTGKYGCRVKALTPNYSQKKHTPIWQAYYRYERVFMAPPAGLEPATTELEVRQEHHPPCYIASIVSMMSNLQGIRSPLLLLCLWCPCYLQQTAARNHL